MGEEGGNGRLFSHYGKKVVQHWEKKYWASIHGGAGDRGEEKLLTKG